MDASEGMQEKIDQHKTLSERQTDLILQMRKNLDDAIRHGIIRSAAEEALLAGLKDIINHSSDTLMVEADFIKARATTAINAYFKTIENLS